MESSCECGMYDISTGEADNCIQKYFMEINCSTCERNLYITTACLDVQYLFEDMREYHIHKAKCPICLENINLNFFIEDQGI